MVQLLPQGHRNGRRPSIKEMPDGGARVQMNAPLERLARLRSYPFDLRWVMQPTSRWKWHSEIHPFPECNANLGKRCLRNLSAQVEKKRYTTAILIEFAQAGHHKILSRCSVPRPHPRPIVAMVLKQPHVRPIGQVIP
jgi:hypothetical protein